MIQRIQTVYLILAMILLGVVSFGMTFISFVQDELSHDLTAFGIFTRDQSGSIVEKVAYPFYISSFMLIILCFVGMMAYKNLTRQLRIVRLTFYIYLLLLISLFIYSVIGDSILELSSSKRELGSAYFLFVCGLPLVFLANLGVKRDKNLLDSLNRLR